MRKEFNRKEKNIKNTIIRLNKQGFDDYSIREMRIKNLKEKYNSSKIANYINARLSYDSNFIKKADTIIAFLDRFFYSKDINIDVIEYLSRGRFCIDLLGMDINELIMKLCYLKKINLDIDILSSAPSVLCNYSLVEINNAVNKVINCDAKNKIDMYTFFEILYNREYNNLNSLINLKDVKRYLALVNFECAYKESYERKHSKELTK